MNKWRYREGLALQVGHVEDLDALHGVHDILRVGRQLGDPLLEVEDLLGELGRLQTGGAQQLNGVFQKHFVRVDRLLTTNSSQLIPNLHKFAKKKTKQTKNPKKQKNEEEDTVAAMQSNKLPATKLLAWPHPHI